MRGSVIATPALPPVADVEIGGPVRLSGRCSGSVEPKWMKNSRLIGSTRKYSVATPLSSSVIDSGRYLVMYRRSCGYRPAATNCHNWYSSHGDAITAAEISEISM